MGTDYQLISQLAGKYPILDFIAIFFAQYLPWLVGFVFVLTLLLKKSHYDRLRIGFFWILSMILASGIISPLIHYFFFRPRPFVAFGTNPLIAMAADAASFPSGHTIFFFTLATVAWLSMNKKWGAWLMVVAVLIGLARVYVGVHFLLDILGGAVIGFLVPVIVKLVLEASGFRVKPSTVEETEA